MGNPTSHSSPTPTPTPTTPVPGPIASPDQIHLPENFTLKETHMCCQVGAIRIEGNVDRVSIDVKFDPTDNTRTTLFPDLAVPPGGLITFSPPRTLNRLVVIPTSTSDGSNTYHFTLDIQGCFPKITSE